MNYTQKIFDEMISCANSNAPEYKKLLENLTKLKPKNLDNIVHELHYDEFEKIDCLECANCCKTLGPMIFESDISRMASKLKMNVPDFKDRYIKVDDEGDYIFNESPCPFLSYDNYCMIYSARPKACKEYPHTNRKRFYQVAIKTYHNLFTCPAVFSIVKRLKELKTV